MIVISGIMQFFFTAHYLMFREKSMSDTTEKRVKSAVAEQLGIANPSEIDSAASFMEDLGADSLDLVELVMAFESDFGISIPDEDSAKLTTVQKAIDYMNSQL